MFETGRSIRCEVISSRLIYPGSLKVHKFTSSVPYPPLVYHYRLHFHVTVAVGFGTSFTNICTVYTLLFKILAISDIFHRITLESSQLFS